MRREDFLILTGVVFTLVFLLFGSGCKSKEERFRQYLYKVDKAIISFNKIVSKYNSLQAATKEYGELSANIEELHREVIQYKKDTLESFILKDPELRNVHIHFERAVNSFENALRMFLEGSENLDKCNELIDKTNEGLVEWSNSVKKMGESLNLYIDLKGKSSE